MAVRILDEADKKELESEIEKVEYQTFITEEAYEHKDLPEGEKTVAINGDGTFGANAYVVCGEDLIPRKTFNRTFPFNGITITRDKSTYHIEGTSTAAGTAYFGETKADYNVELDEDISGKSFKLLTFANQTTGGNLSAVVKFYDSNGATVQVLHSNGSLKNQISDYIASTTLIRFVDFSIPENANIAYMQFYVSFKAGYAFNHDFQVYVVESEKTYSVTSENSMISIADTGVANVFSFPYKSTTQTKAPIVEYINYMARNAKGDTATYLTPEAFGAVGDGYADDTLAIKNALDASVITNQTVIMAKKYLVTAPIDITHSGLDVIANEIIYSGTDTALKIRGQQNTFKIHSITSDGEGITFRDDNGKFVRHNDITINSIVSKSHGIVFYNGVKGICQNTIRFNYIKAGGSGCYGICGLDAEGEAWVTENNFYGGQIANCDWAIYGIGRNSKLYGVQIEGDVRGNFYINVEGLQIFHPRITESQKDGDLPAFKFVDSQNVNIYDSTGIYLNQIDLSEGVDSYENKDGNLTPANEYKLGTINGKIIGRNPQDGHGSDTPCVYTTKAYVWGKFLIMTPHMTYRKVVTTATLDTRLIGTETTEEEIRSLSQLPTKFVVNTINSDIYLHESYCAFGFNGFEVEQANGFTCKVYDKLNNLIFDGTTYGDGVYKLKVYKDSDKCVNYGVGLLRRDFLGHYWEIQKAQGEKGDPYTLTESDKTDIVNSVLANFTDVSEVGM